MKISVITTCLNSEETIEEAVVSVLSQTHSDIEYVVIDGGSQDGTVSILNRYSDRIDILVSEPDDGIYDAMNKGLELATGDVIAILNSDDVYAHSDVLLKVVEIMRSGELDAVFGDVEYFTSDKPDKTVRRYNSASFSPRRISWGWMPAHPALFFRRHVYDRIGKFRTDYRIAGDFEFVARAFRDGKLKYHYLRGVLVRMRTGGVSTAGWRNTLLLNREVLRACRENGIPTNIFKVLSKYPAKLLEYLRA
ncbi:MAG: glycosyltransferase family 2 protein [Candidatus Sedimenticola sp. PURPLELP]